MPLEDKVLRRGKMATLWLKWIAAAYLAFCVGAMVQTVIFQRLGVAWPSLVSITFSMVCVPFSVWLLGKQVQAYGATVNSSQDTLDQRGDPHAP